MVLVMKAAIGSGALIVCSVITYFGDCDRSFRFIGDAWEDMQLQ